MRIPNVFNNLSPKYSNIEHLVKRNDTLNSVLKSYNLPNKEISMLFNSLKSKNIKNSLKINPLDNHRSSKSMYNKLVNGYKPNSKIVDWLNIR